MEKILGKKIELLPKEPQENQIVCDRCGGIGWLLSSDNHITKCNCNDGVWNTCKYCDEPLKHSYSQYCECKESKDQREKEWANSNKERDFNTFKKATKVSISYVPAEKCEMMYSEVYGMNEGYFYDIPDLEDYCKENDIEMPKYVWATYKIGLSFDAYNICEDACSDLHEDALSNISNADIKELQELLDEWSSKQTGTETYYPDNDLAILL